MLATLRLEFRDRNRETDSVFAAFAGFTRDVFSSEVAMRIRGLVAIALLLLPAGLSAQRNGRLPRIFGRGPAQPAPLPPQAVPIARELSYRRSHMSFESYP